MCTLLAKFTDSIEIENWKLKFNHSTRTHAPTVRQHHKIRHLKVLFRNEYSVLHQFDTNPCMWMVLYNWVKWPASQPACKQSYKTPMANDLFKLIHSTPYVFWLLLLDGWSWHWRWLFVLCVCVFFFYSRSIFHYSFSRIYIRCLFDSLRCRKHIANQDNAYLLA